MVASNVHLGKEPVDYISVANILYPKHPEKTDQVKRMIGKKKSTMDLG